MQTRHIVSVAVALILLASGCGDTNVPSSPTSSSTPSNTTQDSETEGVVKIAVLTDGTVIVNSETVPIASLGSKLDSIGTVKEIWYHREAPNAAKPHENAMKVVAEIANRKLPIAMYLDRDFSQRASFGK